MRQNSALSMKSTVSLNIMMYKVSKVKLFHTVTAFLLLFIDVGYSAFPIQGTGCPRLPAAGHRFGCPASIKRWPGPDQATKQAEQRRPCCRRSDRRGTAVVDVRSVIVIVAGRTQPPPAASCAVLLVFTVASGKLICSPGNRIGRWHCFAGSIAAEILFRFFPAQKPYLVLRVGSPL